MHQHPIHVATAAGTVQGFTRDGVHRWRSIPYARPPVGPLRFQAPQPADPWSGVRLCHEFGACAPQERRYTVVGIGKYQPMGEDCLTLNVVAPVGFNGEALPVMVFIHGGAYVFGSSATAVYDGARLARRGCVYVSVNYRLGALGCLDLSSLSTSRTSLDSNLFLRDLVMALRWVKENISAFGGDPTNVTLFGESAGAHAVTTLLTVPTAEGLFHKAIAQSPVTALARSREVTAEFASRFAAFLGAHRREAADRLIEASPAELVRAQSQLIDETARRMLGSVPLGPVFGDDVLPIEPTEGMRRGQSQRIPLIVGTNAHEARLFTRFLPLLPTTEPKIEAVLADIEIGDRSRIIEAYPGYPERSACVRFGGDFAFGAAAWAIADAHSTVAPTYLYRYDYAPRVLRWTGLGATDGTELLAVFDLYRTKSGALVRAAGDQRSALRVSDDIQSRWRSFSRTAVPGPDWPAHTRADRAVMVFDRRPRIEFDPHREQRMAWNGFAFAR